MSIRGAIFENQHPFASDHALAWQACMSDGLLYGCAMSFTDSLFSIGEGFMIVGGRVFELTANENISVSPGTGFARIIVTIDTSATSTETEFEQVAFSVDYAANADSFAELTQGPINTNQGPAIYQAAVAVLNINSTGIAGIETQMEIVTPGGTSLNFSVVGGTTQPTNPKENTIWVNTDTDITEWVFSATEPTSPVEGMVWFKTGTSSSKTFNALKKNGLQVYPTSCKQYIGGTWVVKSAQIFQTAWLPLGQYFYSYGNVFEDVTGGYATSLDNNGKVTFNADNIYLSTSANANAMNRATVYSKNKIDFSDISTLYFRLKIDVSGNSTSKIRWGVATAFPYPSQPTYAVVKSTNADLTEQVVSVDVSSYTGQAYICATYEAYWEQSYGNMTIYEIWGE